jgi:hypothetical protein
MQGPKDKGQYNGGKKYLNVGTFPNSYRFFFIEKDQIVTIRPQIYEG